VSILRPSAPHKLMARVSRCNMSSD